MSRRQPAKPWDKCHWVSYAQIAEHYDVARITLSHWVAAGRLPQPSRSGNWVRFKRVAVEAAIEDRMSGTPAEVAAERLAIAEARRDTARLKAAS